MAANIYTMEQIIEEDGVLQVKGLPMHKGDQVEITVRVKRLHGSRKGITAKELLASDFVGMWADREDMADPVEWVNKLRGREEHRGGVWDDPH